LQILLFQQNENTLIITAEREYNTLYNSFIDCVCMPVRVMDSIDVNFAKHPTGVRPLLVYYWTGPNWIPGIPNPKLGIFIPRK